jgi:hypothetical protein
MDKKESQMNQPEKMNVFLRVAVAMVMLLLLWGCSGGGGDSVQQTGTGSINGQVYEGSLSDNRYLANIPVTLFDSSGTAIVKNTFTNSTGLYHFNGISDGSYKVRFTLNGSSYVWHQRKPDAASATPIAVPSTATDAVNMAVPYTSAVYYRSDGYVLLDSNAATIYYTTNGVNPDTNSAKGVSSAKVPILSATTLKYFSMADGFIKEAIRTLYVVP